MFVLDDCLTTTCVYVGPKVIHSLGLYHVRTPVVVGVHTNIIKQYVKLSFPTGLKQFLHLERSSITWSTIAMFAAQTAIIGLLYSKSMFVFSLCDGYCTH